jgi:lysyl-tRNA synthetase class II
MILVARFDKVSAIGAIFGDEGLSHKQDPEFAGVEI